jgi:hypothetical protein
MSKLSDARNHLLCGKLRLMQHVHACMLALESLSPYSPALHNTANQELLESSTAVL